GIAFLLFMLLLPGEVIRLVGRLAIKPPEDVERRRFLARALAGGITALGAGLGIAGLVSGLGAVAIKRVKVTLSRWRRPGSYVIAQLSDIHIGPTLHKDFLQRIVAQVNELEPDLVVITGDLVDGSVATLGEHVRPLADLRAKDGVYFVTGNHENYS